MSHAVSLDQDKLFSGAPIYFPFANTFTYQDIMRSIVLLTLVVVTFTLTGCGGMHSVMPTGNLEFDSRMSETVFLNSDKLSDERTKIYVRAANTSSFTDIDFQKLITERLLARGFKVTRNAKDAMFVLQANLLYFGEEDSSHTMEGALAGGVGGAIIGGVAAKSGTGALAGGAGGAVLGAALGTLSNTTSIIAITDMMIEERQGKSLVGVARTRLVTRAKQFNANKPELYNILRDKTPTQVAGQFGG